jgi:aminoglycoside 3-N-acetyltransferase I
MSRGDPRGNVSRQMQYSYMQLAVSDVEFLKELLTAFGEAFREFDTYQSAVPSDAYLRKLLSRPHFIALVAMNDAKKVVGGAVAYELEKFEQDRREIYIYDLAVLESHRRKGIAPGLIEELKRLAKERDAYVIFVQADKTDAVAIRLYESLGTKQDVYHFDIMVDLCSLNPR